jgi:uncharacterized protein YjdB
MKLLKVFVPIMVLAMFLVACGGAATMDLNKNTVKLEKKGATATLSAVFKDKKDEPIEAKEAVAWASSDSSVATVSAGQVIAVGTGTATVTATSGAMSASAKVTVQIPAKLVLSPSALKLKDGNSGQFTAKLLDEKGGAITGKKIAFSSNVKSVAGVSGTGAVKAKAAGVATITASYGKLSDSSKVTVSGDKKPKKPKGISKKKTKKVKKAAGMKKKKK